MQSNKEGMLVKKYVNWRKYIVLCLLSVAIMLDFTIRPADAASGRDMEIDHRKGTQWSYLWDYVVDTDDLKSGNDAKVLFPSTGGQPYLIQKEDGKAKIGFWVRDSQNFGGLDGFRMFLGREVLNADGETTADGKTTHDEAIVGAPGSDENGFYYTKNGKIEITVPRSDLLKVIKASEAESVHEYQIRVRKYGEGGGYWTIGRAYDISLNVLGVYNKYYGKWPMPSNYTDTDYWAGEQWGSVIYDVYENQRPIFDMTTQSYTAQPGETFDCTNQDDLRKLVASFTEWQGKELVETKKLSGDKLLHQVDLKDELIRNSTKHKIEYKALKITPINGTPALQEGQTTLTEQGTYEIELRGYYERDTKYPDRNRFVTKKATVKIPFPDVIPEKDEKGNDNRKPDNYVPITFESDGNGTLRGETKYYVNPEKEVDLTDYAAAITKTPNVGFKAEGKWEPEQLKDTFTKATKFVFNFTPYADVIEVKPNEPKPTKPDGYVDVTFNTDGNGTLSGTTLYYVNPNKKVKLTPPKTIGNTGYAFEAWSQDVTQETLYASAKTVTASFKQIDPVQTKETPGYVKVNFVIDGEGGSIRNGETKTYWVDPNREVTLTAPQYDTSVGYKFAQWSPNPQTSRKYVSETTIRGTFRALADVIEVKPNEPKPTKPDGYVDVTFNTDGNGTLSGTTLYYVNPNKKVKLTPPKTIGNTGYAFEAWSQDVTQETLYASAKTVTASFKQIDPVQTKETPGYVKVNFVIDGEGGSIRNGETKTYWVDPNREVTLTAPQYDTMVGYKFEQWSPDPQTAQKYATETTIKGTFVALGDVIEEKPNETRPEGYVTVKTLPTDKATDKTIESYWVKQNTQVTLPVSEPVGKEEIGANNLTHTYHFTGWTVTKGVVASWEKPSSGTTKIAGKFSLDTDITAQYSVSIDPLPVPKKNVESAVGSTLKPEDLIANLPGSGEGSLPEGTTVAIDGTPDLSKAGTTTVKVVVTYPKGNTITVSVPVKVVAGKPTVTPVYTYMGRYPTPEDYKKAITPAKGAEILSIGITENPDVSKSSTPGSPAIGKVVVNYKDGTVQYLDVPVEVYDNVIPAGPNGSKPKGTPANYVQVTMDPTNDAQDPTKQIFYVNPDVAVTLTVTDPVGKTGFEFGSWEKDVSRPTKYGQAEVIHAQFNALGDVLTQQKPGYVKVNFAIDGEGGKIKQGETTTYYVNPSKNVTLKAPETEAEVGFTFNTWNPDPTNPTQYVTEKTIKGTFTALPDIIPNVDESGQPNLQPNGYIPVEFKPGDHGTLEGTTLYWVKPGVEVTVPAPTTKANTNYAFTSWDKSLTMTATAGQAPITITAQWKSTYTPTPNPNQPNPNQPDPNKPGTTPSGDVSVDGKARQDVAANISKTYFPNAKKVIVVQNKAYADSMSAMNISQGNIPILYTGRDTLFSVTMREILRVPREEIIVMGGENSVSNKVFRELQGLSSAKVTRIGGADRFEVNRNSAKYMPNSTTAVIASGMIYTDALSSVPYAHALHAPILLVSKNSVPQAVKDVLYDRMTSAVIVGGKSTVSEATKLQLEKIIGTSIERIGGANRYVVSAAIASRLQNVQHAIITSGELWSDALVAGPMAQRLNAPVLLTPYGGLREGAYNYLLAHPDLKSVITVGGRGSIGQGVHNQVKAIFGSNKQWNLDPAQVVNQ